uniref:Uncharacterized protein n=1 Tax=Cryptosporidium parvum TaxID=5807 RepID=F0X5I9_CRYPV
MEMKNQDFHIDSLMILDIYFQQNVDDL